MIELAVKVCSEDATLPTLNSKRSACFNLYSAEDITIHNETKASIETGIQIEFLNGFYGKILECRNINGSTVASTIIDAEYKDTIRVVLSFLLHQGDFSVHIKKGQLLSQLILEKIEIVKAELL